jgi:hypothetical protein
MSTKTKHELKTVKQIREKLINNNAIVVKADKGNSIVVMSQNDYEQKVLKFISCSDATETNNNVTSVFQKELRHMLNDCKQIVNNSNKWRLINVNPDTPILRGLIKIHKEDMPIRLVINSINVPSYKLAKMFVKKLKTYIPLIYNIKNSIQLLEKLGDIPFIHT